MLTVSQVPLKSGPAPSSARSHGEQIKKMNQTTSPTTPLNTLALNRLLGCLRTLREATGNSELQLQTMTVFLYVASRHPNEVPQGEIETVLSMVQTTVSRNCAYLAKGSAGGLGGYKLIEVFTDIYYRKRKLVKLTKKGEEVARKLAEQIGF
jgi:DNA-binding MarR family transcriptional regulator